MCYGCRAGRDSVMSMDVEAQYDKLYRYCYFKLHNRELAEDVTQEAFLRYFESYGHLTQGQALRCLYTIGRNLCTDQFRRRPTEPLGEELPQDGGRTALEEGVITRIQVRDALAKLDQEEQEILLLRYVNEIPAASIGGILGISRFAVHRRLKAAGRKFREAYEGVK